MNKEQLGKYYEDIKKTGSSLTEIDDAKDFLEERLGGNMNIATLTPFFWYETMVAYAKYCHKSKLEEEGER